MFVVPMVVLGMVVLGMVVLGMVVLGMVVVVVPMLMITIVFTLTEVAPLQAFDKTDDLHFAFALVELGDKCLFKRKICSKVNGSNRKIGEFLRSRGENMRVVIF